MIDPRRTILSGRREIIKFTGRSWPTIRYWIREKGFPAAKIDGRWEADAEEVRQWRKRQIKKARGE